MKERTRLVEAKEKSKKRKIRETVQQIPNESDTGAAGGELPITAFASP